MKLYERLLPVVVLAAIGFAGLPVGAQDAPRDIATQAAENDVAAQQAAANSATIDASRMTIKVAVYNLKLDHIPEGIGKIVTSNLLAEIRKLEGVSAIGMSEIQDMLNLEAQKQIAGCESDASCLTEIAGALGVDELITGQLVEAADGRTFIVRRINQLEAKVISSVNKRLKIGSGEEFLLAIEPIVKEIYAERENRPGTKRGVPKEAILRLNPPPIKPWITTAIAGGAALAGIISGSTYYFAGKTRDEALSQAEKDISAMNSSGTPANPKPYADYQDNSALLNGVNKGSGYVAGTLALTAIVSYFFTDWEGYGEEAEEEE